MGKNLHVSTNNTVKRSSANFNIISPSGVATGVARRGKVPPLTVKKCQKSGKRGEKIRKKLGKIRKKEEKSGRKGKNQEVSFALPLLIDRAGYATDLPPPQKKMRFLTNSLGLCCDCMHA